MSCQDAMLPEPIKVAPDMSVEDAIHLLESHKISAAPVVDGDGTLLGVFSMKILLQNLIPVSVMMVDGMRLDMKMGAAPGVGKRLAHVKPLPVSELMERKVTIVQATTPLWEAVSMLTKHGGSLSVVDEDMKFMGMITYASLVGALDRISLTGQG